MVINQERTRGYKESTTHLQISEKVIKVYARKQTSHFQIEKKKKKSLTSFFGTPGDHQNLP